MVFCVLLLPVSCLLRGLLLTYIVWFYCCGFIGLCVGFVWTFVNACVWFLVGWVWFNW